MKKNSWFNCVGIFLIAAFGLLSCEPRFFRSNYQQANKLLYETKNPKAKPYLKAHLKNGDVCILKNTWMVDTALEVVSGKGSTFDYNRRKIFEGELQIPIDSVALFETNKKIVDPELGRVTALSILAGVDVAVGIFCVINPKACYGSCPTFYLNPNDNFHYADAEGFSNAIVPAMEYADIDALNNKPVADTSFSITMKNEALETHCINEVKLLAYPRKTGERVYQTAANDFYVCHNNYPLSQAEAEEGNITGLLKNEDRQERFSLSDAKNLSSKEEIFLTFREVKNPRDLGLILNFRQTLMTTYLFYSAMGYMGNKVSDMFAMVETDSTIRNTFDATTKELGNIELYAWNETTAKWELQTEFYETGPIAVNRQIFPLKNVGSGSEVKLKLVINKGLWRIDYLALTNIKEKVKPLEISPNRILNKGKRDNGALASVQDPAKYLISMPGSEYKFNFPLPNNETDYELFLYSKGYYLEWMRESWIKQPDLLKLKEMVDNPKQFLRSEAENFKKYEHTMEEQFWDSKIDTKVFSYYED